MGNTMLKHVSLGADELARIQRILPQDDGYKVMKGWYGFPDVDDPCDSYVGFILDNDDDSRTGWVLVDFQVKENGTGFSITDRAIYADAGTYNNNNVHNSYAAKLNDRFLENVVVELTGRLKQVMASRPEIVSTEPVWLYSTQNPTQVSGPPRAITGWSVLRKVKTENGREYFYVRKPNIERPWNGGPGYCPVSVVFVGDVGKDGTIANAHGRVQTEIETHKGADFRMWQLKDDDTLVPLGDNNPKEGVRRINLNSEYWLRELLAHVDAGEGCGVIGDAPVIFVKDAASIPPALASYEWPEGKVLFEKYESYGVQAYGQQTIEARNMENDAEFRRIAQGLSQRYLESLQKLQNATDYLVEANSVKIAKP